MNKIISRLLIFASFLLLIPVTSSAQFSIGVSVGFAPPALPVYEQPVCPGDGYIWTPGYWAWDGDDYFWVPGTWVLAPEAGFFWTPGYWGWGGSGFFFHEGYWGPQVGFYGGIDYGFGYFGHGYEGGRWDHDHFYYNRSVNNVNVTQIHNVYNTTIVDENRTTNHVSYNGGNGGINAKASAQEEAAAREQHMGPVAVQTEHVAEARSNKDLRASVNKGKPPVAATQRAASFDKAEPAKDAGGRYEAPANRGASANNNPANSGRPATHPNELPAAERPTPANSGNAKADQKYQKQQQKLYAQQEKDRQKLQQQQDKEHQNLAKQSADAAKKQQVEQRHQQQTQQLQQRHAQQQQHLEQAKPQAKPQSHPPAAPPH